MRWLFFSYTLPSRPSRARVSIWRQLKKLGAVNYQSVWVLPYSSERVKEVSRLIQDIESWKGEGLLIDGKVLNADQEERINRTFVESRNEEYKEIISKCEDYAKEIEFEIGRRNFIFAEVEENEEELEKLKQWLKKVEKRDIVEVPLRKEAIERIRGCEDLFQEFAKRVYEHTQTKQRQRRKIAKKGQLEPQE